MKTHFKIILTCWNAERWIDCSIKSVLLQSYDNWRLFVVDDCSTDKTPNILKQFVGMKNVVIKRNSRRVTKLQNLITTVKASKAKNEDVIVFIDGDDMLYDNGVLDYLAAVYRNGNVWVTWGSYCEAYSIGVKKGKSVFDNYDIYPVKYFSQFAQPAPENWNIRSTWRYSHLKTTKYFLWKNIRDETFRDNRTKEYYSRVDDFFMIPLLEMAGPEHAKYIRKIMYVRSRINHYEERTAATLKKTRQINREIKRERPYSRRNKESLL